MATWKTRGLRGSSLEEIINTANEVYKKRGLALINKIPTPITPVEIEEKTRMIKSAYFNQKSTVDYIGVVQGIAVCFDAKEIRQMSFPLSNIHKHQYEYMKEFEKQGGISFLIVHFSKKNQSFYLRFEKIEEFFNRMYEGGKKSFSYEEMEEDFMISGSKEVLLHYLEQLQSDILKRYKES